MRSDGLPIQALLWRTFTPAIVLLAIGLGALTYTRLYDTILDGFSRKLVTVSALTGALIDPRDHDFLVEAATVGAPADLIEARPEYQRQVIPLRQIRKDLELTYLYTQKLGGTKDVIYVLDSTVGEEHSNIGAEDELPPDTVKGLRAAETSGGVYVSPIEFQAQWGLLKTAAAPVRDRAGRAVATAGADVNISVIEVATQNALLASALIGVASLAISTGVTLLIARLVAAPIQALKAEALRIAAGDPEPPADSRAPREVTRLRADLADLARYLVTSMRTAWAETQAHDRVRNVERLHRALGPAVEVVLLEEGGRRVVWRPSDDSLEARLECRSLGLLAQRLADGGALAGRWRALAVTAHGALAEEPEA